MTIVAGVDFGTGSVRASIVDSEHGGLVPRPGCGAARLDTEVVPLLPAEQRGLSR
jgi:sugar (pentulose or hexulose) kinase